MAQLDRITLWKVVANNFSLDDLRLLCFELGVNFDQLDGQNSSSKALSLVQYFEKREDVPTLEMVVRRLRPLVVDSVGMEESSIFEAGHSQKADYSLAGFMNPFGYIGRLDDPSLYLVRQPITDQVFEYLHKGMSVSIVGDSQVGKSSLLSYIKRSGPTVLGRSSEDFVYLDLQPLSNL